MLHLINSIYAAVDATVDISVDRIMISKEYAYPQAQLLDDIAEGVLYGFAGSYNDLVGPGKQFPTLAALMVFAQDKSRETGREFIFYCDRQGLADLATNWFKGLLPNASSFDIYRIINSYQVRQRLKTYSSSNIYFAKSISDVIRELSVTQDEVDAAFVSSTVRPSDLTHFIRSNIQGVGLEFLLANYSRNGKNKTEVSNILKDFIVNELVIHASDIKDDIIENIWDPTLRQALGLGDDITLENIESKLSNTSNPVSVFFDKSIWSQGSYNKIHNFKEMSSRLNPTVIGKMFSVFKNLQANWHMAPFVPTESLDQNQSHGYIDDIEMCVTQLNNDDWSLIISRVLNNEFLKNPFISKIHNTVNVYLLEYIISSHQRNKDSLTPYLINGSM